MGEGHRCFAGPGLYHVGMGAGEEWEAVTDCMQRWLGTQAPLGRALACAGGGCLKGADWQDWYRVSTVPTGKAGPVVHGRGWPGAGLQE